MTKNILLKHGVLPRMLDRAAAAAYCGVSINHFLAQVPVSPVLLGSKKLWDRKRLDEYLDQLSDGADHSRTPEEWLALA
jgi:hypothetical protein